MNYDILDNGENILKRCDKLILLIPYSYYDDDIKNLNNALSIMTNEYTKNLVDYLIKAEIFNVNIFVYNVDNTRYRVNTKDIKNEIISKVNKIINNVFQTIFENYTNNYYSPAINGKYFTTLRSITKRILTSNISGNSRRNAIKFDSRKENPIFNEDIKKALKGKLDKVACGLLTNTNYSDDIMNESLFDKALYDVMTYSFIPNNNGFRILVK